MYTFIYINFWKKRKIETEKHIKKSPGTFLVVQWLRLHLPVQGVWIWSLNKELGFYMPWGQKAKTWNISDIVTNSLKTQKKKNVPHQKQQSFFNSANEVVPGPFCLQSN